MRIDLDTYREILDTLTRNKSRSLLTGFGVFWGVFMLVALMGGGQGLKEMLERNFEGFAQNTAMIWAQQTTKPYKGFRKGRWWEMDYKDIERLRQRVPELDEIAPVLFGGWGRSHTAYYGDLSSQPRIQGVTPDYANIVSPKMYYGRYINDMDLSERRKVCVLGKKIYKDLFKDGGDPCGKRIRIDSTYYEVVGVDYNASGGMNFNGRSEEKVTLPLTLVQQTLNRGNQVDLIAVTGRPGVVMSKIAPRIRETIARAHYLDPTDEQGAMVFNTEVLFQMLDNLFKGVNFLIWLVGLGTLLAGAIGVSNIMMVTVRERTTEIGIRRAIGATPKMILSQIISESIVLMLVAGMSGILFGVLILQMLELANTEDGILTAHFQVGFWTALFAALMVSAMGVLAGLAPAARAMSIKPQISGIITQLMKEPGQYVQQGEVIAKVKVIPDMGQLSSAEARVRLADINLQQAKVDFEREKNLFDQKLVSADEYDKVKKALNQAKEEVLAAQDALQVVRDGVSKSNASASSTLVRSTISGVILDIPVKVGNSVILSNTFNDGTTIASVANMNDLIFRGNIDETEVGQLVNGMPMKITIGALQDLKFDAFLEYISPKATESNGANQFEIKAAVKVAKEDKLRSGYSANAEIVLDQVAKALTIPESAIEFSGDSTFVYDVKDAKGQKTYERRQVVTGLSDGVNIEVKKGLTAKEKVRGPEVIADNKED